MKRPLVPTYTCPFNLCSNGSHKPQSLDCLPRDCKLRHGNEQPNEGAPTHHKATTRKPKRSQSFKQLMTTASVITLGLSTPLSQATSWHFHYDHVLGTSVDIIGIATSELVAQAAAKASLAEIVRLDKILSGWRIDSELAALNQAQTMSVSSDLYHVLEAAERWQHETGGAFNHLIGRIIELWRKASVIGKQPNEAELQRLTKALAAVPVKLEAQTRRVCRPLNVSFAIDGLAKGYIVDAALRVARRETPALKGIMIDIGGDIRCWGEAPSSKGWPIGIFDPSHPEDNALPAAVVLLNNQAIATSGRGTRDFNVGGKTYSQNLSPATGKPAEQVVSATVISNRTIDADALASAFSIMPSKESLSLANRLPGVDLLLVTNDGLRHTSKGWHILAAYDGLPTTIAASETEALPVSQASRKPEPSSLKWPAGFSLDVRYEIPSILSLRYRRPYVVIWITDKDNQVVRTLLMLGRRPGWQDDNYIWWRSYGRQAKQIVHSISRPTRSPGRYSVKWDGKNDRGQLVDKGRYTLHIEAARQYGDHTRRAIDLDLGDAPVEHTIDSEGEIGAIKLAFGKRL